MKSDGDKGRMDFDRKQTRRFHLAGTVSFPTPYPTAGGISIEVGSFKFPGEKKEATFVVIQESTAVEESTIRVVQTSNVAAIFCPGVWEDTKEGRIFRFAKREEVRDLDEGEWFLGSNIDADKVSKRLNLAESKIDITRRDSGVRGLVFVQENLPVLTIIEYAESAGDAAMDIGGHCLGPMMEGLSVGPEISTGRRLFGPASALRHQVRKLVLDMVMGRC
jgi:hypothetical protein